MDATLPITEQNPFQEFTWLQWLEQFCQLGLIRQLDYQLAKFLSENEPPEHREASAVLVAAVSFELSKGNSCLTIDDKWSPLDTFSAAKFQSLLDPQLLDIDWLEQIKLSSLIMRNSKHEARPLVYEFGSLYLQKYWQFESQLANKLIEFATPIELDAHTKQHLSQELDRLFEWQWSYLFKDLQGLDHANDSQWQRIICEALDIEEASQIEWGKVLDIAKTATGSSDLESIATLIPQSACKNYQKIAAATALLRRLCVISGGPGTGKTTTVSKLLAALVSSVSGNLNIKLAAPTGKAAARLTESIGQAIDSLPVSPQIKERIPTTASTIHRLLGARAGKVDFKHNAHNPLHLDLLILDEASMVDLPLMHKLLDALPKHARLILLGDRDQLSSVEAGSVLGDICALQAGLTQSYRQALTQLTGYNYTNTPATQSAVADSLTTLRKSYRFHSRSGIGMLAKAINNGDADKSLHLVKQNLDDVQHSELESDSYNQLVIELGEKYRAYLELRPENEAPTRTYAAQVLKQFSTTRLLCAVREGEFGVEGLNQKIEQRLASKGLIAQHRDTWYLGRPIMITTNDHSQQLYNGDIGICLMDTSDSTPRMKVFFEQPDGGVKAVLPSRVPAHETAFAMTIHKSQGSEFKNTYLLLPKLPSPILTRELFYTGVTRAKSFLKIIADDGIIKRSVMRKTERSSHLSQRLDIQR